MWMLTEGSVLKLQDCREGSSPIGSGTARAFLLCPVYTVHLATLKRWPSVSVCCAGWSFESTSSSPCVHIATPYGIRVLAGIGFLRIRIWKRFHPGAFRTAEQESKLSCPFSCRYWKLQILDLWILQKRLISVASAGFHFYWELIAQPWGGRYARWNQECY